MSEGHHPSPQECHAFAVELCKGYQPAIDFVNCWYRICHAVDDLIDTREDGRPTMNSEQILSIWAHTALMYNSPFYIANRHHLFPITILVTNLYATSVAWERSPINRRRIMGDALRTCGDYLLFIVAMLVPGGDWAHCRAMTDKILEVDWIRQHDADDKPN